MYITSEFGATVSLLGVIACIGLFLYSISAIITLTKNVASGDIIGINRTISVATLFSIHVHCAAYCQLLAEQAQVKGIRLVDYSCSATFACVWSPWGGSATFVCGHHASEHCRDHTRVATAPGYGQPGVARLSAQLCAATLGKDRQRPADAKTYGRIIKRLTLIGLPV